MSALNQNNGANVVGDTGEDIPEPADPLVNGTTLFQPIDIFCDPPITVAGCNVLADAYVRPVYDVVDPRDNSFFQANVGLPGAPADVRALFRDWDSSSTNTSDDFWSVI